MIVKLNNIPSKTIAILLIVIIGIFSLNDYLYLHKHLFRDGSIVVHAHPYNKSNDNDQNKSHGHETGDLVYLAGVQVFIPAVIFVFVGSISSVKHVFPDKTLIFNPLFVYLFNQERAPPHCI